MEKYSLKDFIEKILIEGVEKEVETNPYVAFFVLCALIEVLGKTIDPSPNIHDHNNNYFKKAMENISALSKYKGLKNELYKQLRCGLLHAGIPGVGLKLMPIRGDLSKKEIGCRELYEDIKLAWKEILDNQLAQKNLSMPMFEINNTTSGMTQDSITRIEEN